MTPTRGDVSLRAAGAVWIALDIGQPARDVCRVAALTRRARPVRGIAIRYRILAGPGRFPNNAREWRVRTDRQGYASVEMRTARKGSTLVAAELSGDRTQSVFFRVNSSQCTHNLTLRAPETVPASDAVVKVSIDAIDQHNMPAAGARLTLEAGRGKDIGVRGSVRADGAGHYVGTIRLPHAGGWVLSARDEDTKVLGSRHVFVLPGRPHHIRLVGETDPRCEPPYDRVLLRAQLEDAHGNPLDPHRIRCRMGGKSVATLSIVGDEARFLVSCEGSGSANVIMSDAESKIRRRFAIDFAPAWLSNPGLVHVGGKFCTNLHLAPTAGRKVRKARIRLRMNSRRTAFLGFTPNPKSGLNIEFERTSSGAMIIVTPRDGGDNAEPLPPEVFVGTCEWECLGEGRSCFVLFAAMSPESPGWELCVDQKKDREKCLCVNLIYREGDDNAIAQGRIAESVIATILSSLNNVARCCPHIKVEKHETPISAADWAASIVPNIGTRADGTPAVTSAADQHKLLEGALGQRTRCLNFLMMPLAWPDGRIGSTYKPNQVGGRARGMGVVDPAGVNTDPNVMAHETGHALGLDDGGPPENLMNPTTVPSGVRVTAAECITIWRNIDRYKC
jgi:hypothetical protein